MDKQDKIDKVGNWYIDNVLLIKNDMKRLQDELDLKVDELNRITDIAQEILRDYNAKCVMCNGGGKIERHRSIASSSTSYIDLSHDCEICKGTGEITLYWSHIDEKNK